MLTIPLLFVQTRGEIGIDHSFIDELFVIFLGISRCVSLELYVVSRL